MRTLITRGLAAAGVLALAGTAAAQGDNPRNHGHKLTAALTGEGGGDPDAAGLFEALVNPETERICYTLSAGNIDKATVAQIRRGGAGESGDPVLTLDTPDGDDDDSEECQDIDTGLVPGDRVPDHADVHSFEVADQLGQRVPRLQVQIQGQFGRPGAEFGEDDRRLAGQGEGQEDQGENGPDACAHGAKNIAVSR